MPGSGFWKSKPPLGTQVDLGHPLAAGLVLFMPLNEGAGQLVSSGVGNSRGRLVGTMGWRFGQRGPAVGGSGAGNRVDIDPAPPIITKMTELSVAALIKPGATSRLDHVSQWGGTGEHFALLSGITASKWQFYVSHTGVNAFGTATGPIDLSTDRYDFVVGTFDGANARCYVNGQFQGLVALAAKLWTGSTQPLLIGASGDAAGNGDIAYVGIWNRALTPQEVQSLTADPYQIMQAPVWRRLLVGAPGAVITPPTTNLLLTTFAPVVSPDHQVVTPPAAALTTANFSPTVLVSGISEGLVIGSAISFVGEGKIGAPDTVVEGPVTATPTTAALVLTSFAPQVNLVVTPTTPSLVLSVFSPTVVTPVVETPSTASLALMSFAPTAATPSLVTPATVSLSLTVFAPTASVTVLVTPETLALSLSAFAPTVAVSDHQTATPSTASLALTAFAPSVTVPGAVVPGVAPLSIAFFAPTVLTPSTATPALIALTIAPFAPAIGLPNLVTPTVRALTTSLLAPTVSTSANQFVTPEALALSLSGFAPSVGAPVQATPNVIALSLSTFTPSIATPRVATPQLVALALSAFVPTIIAHQLVTPTAALLLLSTFAVTIVVESEAEPLIITGTLDMDSILGGTLDADSVISGTLDADVTLSGTLGS